MTTHSTVSFIGLGRMGQAMAARLSHAGFDLVLFNRNMAKIAHLAGPGRRVAAKLGEALQAEFVISMLPDDSALVSVAHAPDGLLNRLPRGAIHIAMGTHDVQVIRDLARAHAAAGQTLVSAPVLGRPEMVEAGAMGIIAGGPDHAIEACQGIFAALGRRVFRSGDDPGSAAALKLANNFLLACAIEAIGEAFSLVEKSGGAPEVFYEVMTDGLFAAPAYRAYGRIIADKDYDRVGFTTALALKDVGLALRAGEIAGVPLPTGAVCRDRLIGAMAHGDGERDWSVLGLEQARASGLA